MKWSFLETRFAYFGILTHSATNNRTRALV